MDESLSPTAPTATTPEAAPSVTAPAPVERTLQQFRADRAKEQAATTEPAPVAQAQAHVEPPEPAEEPEAPETPDLAAVKAPEQGANHRWKDPETGIVLDMRRKDHRRMKRALEDRHALAQQLHQARTAPPQEPPQARQAPQQSEAAPQLEDFADQPDPYRAYMDAAIAHGVKQTLNQHLAERSTVERTTRVQAAIGSAQSRFDAALPTVRERYPDFDAAHQDLHETLARVPLPVRGPIIHRLLTHPQGHDLAYHLGNHPEDLARLVRARTPQEQQYAMGEIAASVKARLSARPAAPLNPPAAPMAPVNGGGTPTGYNPATATLAQFRKKHGVRGGRAIAS